MIAVGTTVSSVTQFITVIIIFIFVVGITLVTTKWVASFQKEKLDGRNIKIIETNRISQNKYIQIVKIADRYFAYAVCKDTVTMISEIDGESLDLETVKSESISFKDFLKRAKESEKDN